MELHEFIKRIEDAHFRTESDTGANFNALFIWNQVRKFAGLEPIDKFELRRRHAATSDYTMEELAISRDWLDRYQTYNRETEVLRKYGVPKQYWPKNNPLEEE